MTQTLTAVEKISNNYCFYILTKQPLFGIIYKYQNRGVAQLGRKIDRSQCEIKGDFSSGSDLAKTSEVTSAV